MLDFTRSISSLGSSFNIKKFDPEVWVDLKGKALSSSAIQLVIAALLLVFKPQIFEDTVFKIVEILVPTIILLRLVVVYKIQSLHEKTYLVWLFFVFAVGLVWSSYFSHYIQQKYYDQAEVIVFGYIMICAYIAASGSNFSADAKSFFIYIATLSAPVYFNAYIEVSRGHSPIKAIYITALLVLATQQRRVNEAVWKSVLTSKKLLAEIIENFQGPVSVVRSNRYVFANSKVGALVGKTPQDIVGSKIGSLNPDDPIVKKIQEMSSNEEKFVFKQVDYSGDGKGSRFYVYFHRLENGDILVISLDVTRQKELEDQLEKERVRLQAANRLVALGEMSAGISHEINNPLSIQMIAATKIIHQVESLSPDLSIVKSASEKIISMSERIAKIVKGLQTFARDDSKGAFFEVDLVQLTNETVMLYQARFNSRGIKLNLQFPNQKLIVEARPGQLSQVVFNVLVNAFDACLAKIQSEKLNDPNLFPQVSIQIENLERLCRLKISDNGIGMNEANRNKLFQPFFTTKDPDKGNGLSLSIAKGIVDDHHGKIYFEFSDDQTTCIVDLPKYESAF